MTPRDLLLTVVRPTLQFLGPPYDGERAETMLVVIALQESRIRYRHQISGPARSHWQVELPTALAVIDKWARARSALTQLGLTDGPIADWLPYSELGACIIARGILYLDPHPLPELGDERGAWVTYCDRCWRPGRPHPQTWAEHYAAALDAVRAA